jgi:hypothetical protein
MQEIHKAGARGARLPGATIYPQSHPQLFHSLSTTFAALHHGFVNGLWRRRRYHGRGSMSGAIKQ